MKYSLVHSNYDYRTNDINLYCRDENYKKILKKVHGFEPYAFTSAKNKDEILSHVEVTSVKEIDIPFVDDEFDKQIIFKTESPKIVGDIRKYYQESDDENIPKFDIHEADIPFSRRFLIDNNIFCGFECDDKELLHPHEIKPITFIQPPRKVFFDIETSIEEDLVTIVGIFDEMTKKYVSVVIDPDGRIEKRIMLSHDHTVFVVMNEESLVRVVKKVFSKIDADILTAWYVKFDAEKLDEKSVKYHRCEFDFSSTNVFDMLKPYKKLYNKGSNKLKDVITAEKLDVPGYRPYQQRYWREDYIEAVKINKTHVDAIYVLDKKLEILDTYWNFKSIAGFEDMNPTVYHGSIIDIRLLRKYHGKYILPSRPSKEVIRKRKNQIKIIKVGGKVFDPPYGRFENIAFYDMSRYYPELIIGQNLTFENYTGDGLGLLPELALELIEERRIYDDRLDELEAGTPEHKQVKFLRDTIKFILNSIFGYTGWTGARCFRLDIFNGITVKGQEGLMFVRDKSSHDGKKLIYGDSVSGNTNIHVFSRGGNHKIDHIKNIYDRYSNSSYKEHDKEYIDLSSHNLMSYSLNKQGKVSLGKIKKIMRHKTNKKMYKITSESGRTITVTEDHSLMIYDNGKVYESSPKTLNTDSSIIVYDSDLQNMWIGEEGSHTTSEVQTQYTIHKNLGTRDKRIYFGMCDKDNSDGIRVEKISSIEEVTEDSIYVYDLEISKYHTFLANDIFVHNTDSTALIIPNNEESKELVIDTSLVNKLLENGTDKEHVQTIAHALEYTDTLNKYLKEFCADNGFTRNLELKMDRFFKNILFKKVRERVGGRWVERGAKKRYVGRVIYEKGPVDYLKITGFEYVRKDASAKTKEIQPKIFEYILDNKIDELCDYMRNMLDTIKTSFDNGDLRISEIAIPTTLKKNPGDYGGLNKNGDKLTPPEYVRGALFSNEWLGEDIRASDQVKMIYVRKLRSYPPTDVISYTDESTLPKDLVIDLDKHIERTIRMPIEKVIDSIDLSWQEIFTPNNKLW